MIVLHEVCNDYCPTCGTEAPIVCKYYEWFGPTPTCLGCGERWHDGEMEPRPFERGWRKQRIASALKGIIKAKVVK